MNRFIIQYYFRTPATLIRKEDRQNRHLPTWKFTYTDIEIALNDSIANIGGCDLPVGLNMIIDLQANSEQEAIEKSMNLCEMNANLLAFSTFAFCESGRITNIIRFNENKLPEFKYSIYEFGEKDLLFGSSILIDEDIFTKIYEAYNKCQHQQRVMRALSWFRKGIEEEQSTDEFTSYWIGLEVIKCVLRRNLKTQVKSPSEWDGVKNIYESVLGYSSFIKVNELRNELLHGFRELSYDFINEIVTYIEPVRKTLITGLGEILGLEKDDIDSIRTKTIRKTTLKPLTIIQGEIDDLPIEFEKFVEDCPKIALEMQDMNCEFDTEGDLRISGKQKLRCSPNAKFHLKSSQLLASDAKIKSASIKLQK